MSDIFIEWDRDRLVVAEGHSEGSTARIRSAAVIERAAESQDTFDAVDRLKTMFPATGGKARPRVTVVFPRQQVTIHRIQIPQVPDHEIPDIVRLQASMRLTVPVESVCMDFTPLPITAGSPTRDVLLVTVPQEQVALARRTVADAGLQLTEVRVSAYCVAQAAAQAGLLTVQADSAKVDIVALMRRDFIELTFVRGSAVVFSHSGNSWPSADAIERTVRSELTRARMSAAENLGEHTIGRLILIGAPEDTAAVTDKLSTRLDGAVIERLDPQPKLLVGTLPDGIEAIDFVTVAGAMTSRADAVVESVDLINPRRAPAKRDLRRVKLLGGALAALLLIAAGYFWRQNQITTLTSKYNGQLATNTEAKEELKAGESDLQQAELISAWVQRDVNWLDEMVRLQELLPKTDRMFVDKFSFNIVQRNGICSIKIEAFAKAEPDINNLARRLEAAGYGVTAAEPGMKSSAVSDYGWWAAIDVVPPVRDETRAAAGAGS